MNFQLDRMELKIFMKLITFHISRISKTKIEFMK
jgi:hypothetical protein